MDGQPPGTGRDSVDSPQRGKVAGPSGRVPFAVHVLAAIARLGTTRGLADDLANLPGRVEPEGTPGLERSVYRRQFRFRKKGGAGVGKTKRGKGTKWMVVVDGEGIPLGNHLGSASSAEVKLAETALASIPRSAPRTRGGAADHVRNRNG